MRKFPYYHQVLPGFYDEVEDEIYKHVSKEFVAYQGGVLRHFPAEIVLYKLMRSQEDLDNYLRMLRRSINQSEREHTDVSDVQWIICLIIVVIFIGALNFMF